MFYNRVFAAFVCAALVSLSIGAGQGRVLASSPEETKVDVSIALTVAGTPCLFEGKAACRHAPVASIYSVAAEMWSVQQSDGQRSITLTLWHPRNSSGDMFSLSVAIGGKSYVVNTIKAGGESSLRGSGKVILTTLDAGGTFTVNATAANGAAITGTIKCSAFTAAIAEGN